MLAQPRGDILNQIFLFELNGRNIDGDWHLDAIIGPCARLPDGFVDHPVADRHDEAAMFRDRNELIRAEQAELGMFPADQGFDGTNHTGFRNHFRLVMEQELNLLDRVADAGLHRQRLKRGSVEARHEVLKVAAAAILRQIHCRVRVANQGIGCFAIFRKHTDADRTRHREHLVFQRKRLTDRLRDFLRHRRNIFGRREIGDNDDKFIAAQPAHHIGAAQARL